MERGEYFEFFEVAGGVHAAIVLDGAGALGNACIVDFGEYTVVFDTTQSLSAARELRATARSYTGKDVSIVVNSHCHNDHVLGNQIFNNATIISTGATRSAMAERLPRFLEFAKAHPEYPQAMRDRLLDNSLTPAARWEVQRDVGDIAHLAASLPEYDVKLPTLCFESNLELHGANRRGQLLTYGGGHSVSDCVLLLPEDGVLLIADLAAVGYHNAMKDGNPEQWLTILDEILSLDFDTVVAGHGAVGTRRDVELTRDYLTHLIETAKLGPNEVAQGVPGPYQDWRSQSIYDANLKFLAKYFGTD